MKLPEEYDAIKSDFTLKSKGIDGRIFGYKGYEYPEIQSVNLYIDIERRKWLNETKIIFFNTI